MATRRSTRTSQKAASASSATSTENPTRSPDRSTVLKVKKSSEGSNKRTGQGSKIKKKPIKKKAADKFDALKPKKPPTAFFYFLEDFRKEYQEKNPDIKSMRDVGKACGEKWKTMTYEEKVQYYDVATEKRAEFEEAMADFVKKKENGEYEEYEEDSDFDS